nr:ankycorbin-like [Cherax quadricarinatus]
MMSIHQQLVRCAEDGDVAGVFEALEQGAEVDQVEEDPSNPLFSGRTALHYAACQGNLKVVRLLLQWNADVNRRSRRIDDDGGTPLHMAAYAGQVRVIKALIGAGANCEARDYKDKTAVHWAALEGQLAALEVLKDQGCDLHYRAEGRSNAMHFGAASGNMDVVLWLAENGVRIDLRDNTKKLPQDLAKALGYRDIYLYLKELGSLRYKVWPFGKSYSSLSRASSRGKVRHRADTQNSRSAARIWTDDTSRDRSGASHSDAKVKPFSPTTRVESKNGRLNPTPRDGRVDPTSRDERVDKRDVELSTPLLTEPSAEMKPCSSQVTKEERRRLQEDRDTDISCLSKQLNLVLQRLGQVTQQLDQIRQRLDHTQISQISQHLADTQHMLGQTNQRLDQTNQRLDQTNQRLDQTNRRLDQTNQRLGETDQRLDQTWQKLEEVRSQQRDLGGRQQFLIHRAPREHLSTFDTDQKQMTTFGTNQKQMTTFGTGQKQMTTFGTDQKRMTAFGTDQKPMTTSATNKERLIQIDVKKDQQECSQGETTSTEDSDSEVAFPSGVRKVPPCGLPNLGNTCYINAVIQCLFHMNTLRDYFVKDTYRFEVNRESEQRGEVAHTMGGIFKALTSARQEDVNNAAKVFKHVVGLHEVKFRGSRQIDAHDLLAALLTWLHNDLMKADWTSVISDLFHGEEVSEIICHEREAENVICRTSQPFPSITLPVVHSNMPWSLQEMLKNHYRTQKIDWECEECGRSHECSTRANIVHFPRVLTLHFSRYNGQSRDDLKTRVTYPAQGLTLQGYKDSNARYQLCGVVNHEGTMTSGHYTAFCRRQHDSSHDWFFYDDAYVTHTNLDTVLGSSEAHLLFYTQE